MSRARRRTVKALVVLGSILAFLSILSIWVERQALNTDDWVETSGRLIQNEEIRSAVGGYLVDQLYANVDVERELEGILPGETKELAGPVSGGLRQVAGSGAEEVLKSSTAQELWRDANRAAHEQLLAVLENKKEAVSTANGKVTLNLGGLVTNLADQVGIGSQLAEKLPPDAGQITILRSDQLKTAQDIVVGIKGLALVFSLLTLLCLGLAVYLSKAGRWVTVLFCGIGLAAAGFAAIVFRSVAGGIVVDQLVKEESVRPAAEAAWSIGTSLMVSIATTVIVFGALAGLAGWLGSPTGSARASRRFMAPPLRDHVAYVYTGLVIVVCIYFLSSPTQNLRSFLTTLIIGGFIAFGIHEMRRQTEEEFPDARLGDYFGGARERVVGAVKSANLGERASKLRLPEVRRPGDGVPPERPTEPLPAQPAAPAGTAAPIDEEDARLRRLGQLADLRDKGVLTDEEFAAEKARVLGGGSLGAGT
ncbi:MAG TPA: SHOCT domain-containing protein [Solirubrobacterales bacterium]|nr:SHOCT domain-containing protein [Solirubrobacterales bacterium]